MNWIFLLTSSHQHYFFFDFFSNYFSNVKGPLKLALHFSSFQWKYSLNKHLNHGRAWCHLKSPFFKRRWSSDMEGFQPIGLFCEFVCSGHWWGWGSGSRRHVPKMLFSAVFLRLSVSPSGQEAQVIPLVLEPCFWLSVCLRQLQTPLWGGFQGIVLS